MRQSDKALAKRSSFNNDLTLAVFHRYVIVVRHHSMWDRHFSAFIVGNVFFTGLTSALIFYSILPILILQNSFIISKIFYRVLICCTCFLAERGGFLAMNCLAVNSFLYEVWTLLFRLLKKLYYSIKGQINPVFMSYLDLIYSLYIEWNYDITWASLAVFICPPIDR